METQNGGMGPQEIHCPRCGRVLLALRAPHCNWCGAPISAADFAAIAAQSREVIAQPDALPLPPITSVVQRAEWGWQRRPNTLLPWAVQSFRPATVGQARLRLAVLILFGGLAFAKLAYLLYGLWLLHHLMQTLPAR